MERSATAFTAADRIGQLAVQIERHRTTRGAMLERSSGGRSVTLWAGRVGDGARARGVGVPARRRRRAAAVRPRRRRCCTRGACTRPGSSTTRSSPRWRSGSRRSTTIDAADEDVHSSIERQLGEVGRKIHAGRSRNDQVAAAFRLYVVDACARGRRGARRASRGACSTRAAEEADDADAGLHAPAARAAR